MKLVPTAASPQHPLADHPYDRWVNPDGDLTAEFYRLPTGFLVRFPEQADFAVDLVAQTTRCTPASDAMTEVSQSLFHNAIEPLVGNYTGGLFLHGSAVSLLSGGGIAFLGESRRGKTTLAGAFAKAGHPFLTEDTVALTKVTVADEASYLVQPSRPVLRLFPDSANHLLGRDEAVEEDADKSALDASGHLPFAKSPAALRAIYILGPGSSEQVTITALPMPAALAELMRHGFILDVEDKVRLRGHFQRVSDLVTTVTCYALDFPRDYAQLGQVVESIHTHAQGRPSQ